MMPGSIVRAAHRFRAGGRKPVPLDRMRPTHPVELENADLAFKLRRIEAQLAARRALSPIDLDTLIVAAARLARRT